MEDLCRGASPLDGTRVFPKCHFLCWLKMQFNNSIHLKYPCQWVSTCQIGHWLCLNCLFKLLLYDRSWPPLSCWHALCPRSTVAPLNRPSTAPASRRKTLACMPALPPRRPFRLVAMASIHSNIIVLFDFYCDETDTNLSFVFPSR